MSGGAAIADFSFTTAIYFSFVTLATLGYGDIVPQSEVARGVTVVEAIVGQLYLAVLIARLVSNAAPPGRHEAHATSDARGGSPDRAPPPAADPASDPTLLRSLLIAQGESSWPAKSSAPPSAVDVVRLLVEVADADTVYRDVYLARARALLADELSLEQYRGFRGIQQQIDEAVATSRAATILQDWKLVQELASAPSSSARAPKRRPPLMAVGELVYDAPTVADRPVLARPRRAREERRRSRRAARQDRRRARAAGDRPTRPNAAFYEARRAFFAGLAVARARSPRPPARRATRRAPSPTSSASPSTPPSAATSPS